jgi:hypothetical protein
MAARPLEVHILRKGRKEDVLDVTADPADTIALRALLKDWLQGHGWAQGHWPDFELVAFDAGTWKRVAKVRARG